MKVKTERRDWTCNSLDIQYLWSVEEVSSVEGALTETTNFLRRSLQTERTEEDRKEKSRMEGKHGSIPLKKDLGLR